MRHVGRRTRKQNTSRRSPCPRPRSTASPSAAIDATLQPMEAAIAMSAIHEFDNSRRAPMTAAASALRASGNDQLDRSANRGTLQNAMTIPAKVEARYDAGRAMCRDARTAMSRHTPAAASAPTSTAMTNEGMTHAHSDGAARPTASPVTMFSPPDAIAAPAHTIERWRWATTPSIPAATSPAMGADHATAGPAAPMRAIVPSPNLNVVNVASTGLAPTAQAIITASSLRRNSSNAHAQPAVINVAGTPVSAATPHAARITPIAAMIAIRGDAHRRF